MVDRLIAPDQLPDVYGGKAPVEFPTGQALPLQDSFSPTVEVQKLPLLPTVSHCTRVSGGGSGGGIEPTSRRRRMFEEASGLRKIYGFRGRFSGWTSTLTFRAKKAPSQVKAVAVPSVPLAEARLTGIASAAEKKPETKK